MTKKLLATTVLTYLILVIIYYVAGIRAITKYDIKKVDTFSALSEPLAAVISGFALLGLMYTLHQQTRQLELQRVEIERSERTNKRNLELITQQNKLSALASKLTVLNTLLSSLISNIELADP